MVPEWAWEIIRPVAITGTLGLLGAIGVWVKVKGGKFLGKVDKIFKELSPNSGTSLSDQIRATRKDVADMKAEQSIIAARQLGIMKDSTVPWVWTDAQGEIFAVSQGYIELIGIDAHAARDRGWRQRVYHGDRDRVDEEWDAVVKGKHHDTIRFRVYSPDKTQVRWIESEIQTTRLTDAARTCVGFQCKLKALGVYEALPEAVKA